MPSEKSNELPLSAQAIIEKYQALSDEITRVASRPSTEKIWCKIGDLHYGHPVTPLILRYRAMMWMAMHPPDPRGTRMFKRPGPYIVKCYTKDLATVFNMSQRSAQRALQMIRIELGKKKNGIVTVEEFCFLNGLKEETIQKKLCEIWENKWNSIKRKHSEKYSPDDD